MKKVNWGTIVIITGIIGWILTALYGAAKRLDCKYWKEKFEKEWEKGFYWELLARDFKRNWERFDIDDRFYRNQLNDCLETYNHYAEKYGH